MTTDTEEYRVLADALNARTEELATMYVRMELLRRWLNENTKVQVGDNEDPVAPTLKILNDTSTFVKAVWPVLQTMWGNAVHVMREAGLIGPPTT